MKISKNLKKFDVSTKKGMLKMAYIIGDYKSKIDFDAACEPYINALKTAVWGWCG